MIPSREETIYDLWGYSFFDVFVLKDTNIRVLGDCVAPGTTLKESESYQNGQRLSNVNNAN